MTGCREDPPDVLLFEALERAHERRGTASVIRDKGAADVFGEVLHADRAAARKHERVLDRVLGSDKPIRA